MAAKVMLSPTRAPMPAAPARALRDVERRLMALEAPDAPAAAAAGGETREQLLALRAEMEKKVRCCCCPNSPDGCFLQLLPVRPPVVLTSFPTLLEP
jgi:hypothetical protein